MPYAELILMSEIWQIIGLSSLIASIINIIGNVISNIYVAKKRFQRESEAGYIQSQIQLYSKIYFLIQRIRLGAISELFFQDFVTDIKDLNDIMSNSSFLLETEILLEWININNLFDLTGKKGGDGDAVRSKLDELTSLIREHVNEVLNPLYKEVVGITVPYLIDIVRVRGSPPDVGRPTNN